MANVQQKGYCYCCGVELGKTAMKNHILKEHAAGTEKCCLVRIEGMDKNYWLYVDMPLRATLNSLDRFLRRIWLECCGHMSAFMGAGYTEIGKARKLENLAPGSKLRYEYDFGDTTELTITLMDPTERPAQREAVRLLARNKPFVFECGLCEKPAVYVDQERMYGGEYPFLCEECAEKDGAEMLLPITNSPRMGVCAYTGELDDYEFDPEKFAGVPGK